MCCLEVESLGLVVSWIILDNFQTAILLLRIDDIVSGTKRQQGGDDAGGAAGGAPMASEGPEP